MYLAFAGLAREASFICSFIHSFIRAPIHPIVCVRVVLAGRRQGEHERAGPRQAGSAAPRKRRKEHQASARLQRGLHRQGQGTEETKREGKGMKKTHTYLDLAALPVFLPSFRVARCVTAVCPAFHISLFYFLFFLLLSPLDAGQQYGDGRVAREAKACPDQARRPLCGETEEARKRGRGLLLHHVKGRKRGHVKGGVFLGASDANKAGAAVL